MVVALAAAYVKPSHTEPVVDTRSKHAIDSKLLGIDAPLFVVLRIAMKSSCDFL